MQLIIVRDRRDLVISGEPTLGVLFVEGEEWNCQTQEPPVRADGVFVPGETCLPIGRYNLSISHCRRFGRMLPLLASTRVDERRRAADRIGMRIHPGHTAFASPFDACGEILVGQARDGRAVVRTAPAFATLWGLLHEATVTRNEAVDVEIT